MLFYDNDISEIRKLQWVKHNAVLSVVDEFNLLLID